MELDEKTLVIRTSQVEKLCRGETGVVEVNFEDFLNELKNGFFLTRQIAETDESLRQVIPYIVLKEKDKYIFFRRTTNQTEKRLHNLITAGVGGHINEEDSIKKDPVEAFYNGLWRELKEEVNVEVFGIDYIGLINVVDNEVSRVHIGVLYIAHVEYHGIAEKDKFEEIRTTEPSKYIEEMEGWAKVVALKLEQLPKLT